MSALRPRKRIVLTEEEGTITTLTERKNKADTLSSKSKVRKIPTTKLPVDPAYVSIGAGLTENLGNFESLRIDVRVSLPCGVSDAEVKETAKRASDLVQEFIEQERRNALGDEGATDR